MRKNLTVKQEKPKKFRSIEDIKKDQRSWSILENLIDEALAAKQQIASQQQIIKDLREAALEQVGIKPALFNDYVRMIFNNDYQQRKEGLEQQLSLVEIVMGADPALTHDDE